MSEIKPCPFCGGGQNSHEDWCFILMCLVNEEQAMFGNKRLFTEEQLANAWNKRAESTCEWHRCEETDEWVCHKCGGSLAGCMFDPVRDGFVCVPNFCPNCGEKVVK